MQDSRQERRGGGGGGRRGREVRGRLDKDQETH